MSQRCAARRLRSYRRYGRGEEDTADRVLPLEDRDSGEAQEGRQGPGLHPAEPDCRARGYAVDPGPGEGDSAPGACRRRGASSSLEPDNSPQASRRQVLSGRVLPALSEEAMATNLSNLRAPK